MSKENDGTITIEVAKVTTVTTKVSIEVLPNDTRSSILAKAVSKAIEYDNFTNVIDEYIEPSTFVSIKNVKIGKKSIKVFGDLPTKNTLFSSMGNLIKAARVTLRS